ncbi:MAG: OadG family protein [Ruminococcus sp.]|nr:OadG family protein [Ruminococcus sp.]
MGYSLLYSAQTLANKSTIPPDRTDLDAGTVASVVITGISVVFIGLILLIICVTVYGKIFEALNKRSAEKAKAKLEASAAKKAEPAPAKPAVPEAPVVESGIDGETVAVIMAAISAMSAASGKKMVLKSVKTAKPQRSAWSAAGIMENTRPF